jgi:hypothetical protein
MVFQKTLLTKPKNCANLPISRQSVIYQHFSISIGLISVGICWSLNATIVLTIAYDYWPDALTDAIQKKTNQTGSDFVDGNNVWQ